MIDFENIKRKYNDKELFIIGALDCFGVPYTPDNIKLKSYIDMIADDMILNDINVRYVNLHSLGCNKTYSLKKIITSDYTKKEYYNINLEQTKKAFATDGILPFPVNPNFLSSYYKNIIDPNLKIISHYCDVKNPIFFYSCGQMNFHSYVNMRSNDIRKIVPEVTFRFYENFFKTMYDIKEVIDYLIVLNPTVDIYMFGVYPMFKETAIRYALAPVYMKVNKMVEKFFSDYENVHFVDVIGNITRIAENDCHPSYKGQCYMKDRMIKVLKKVNELSD